MQKIEKKTIEGKSASTKNIIHKSDKGKKDFTLSKRWNICLFVVITLLLGILSLQGYITLNKNLLNAVKKGDIQAVQRALKRGAHVNARVSESNTFQKGTTALMLATIRGYTDIVELLLENGVDIHAEDADGKTALSYAQKSKQPYSDVITTLLKYAKEGKQPNTLNTLFETKKVGRFDWTEEDTRQALASFYVKHNPVFWGCNSDPSTLPTKEEELQCFDYQTFLEKGWGQCSIINYAFQKYAGLKKKGRYRITSVLDYLIINGIHYADHDVTILQIENDKNGNNQHTLIDPSLGWVITCSGDSPDDCIREWGTRTKNYHISGTKEQYTANGWNKLKFLINDKWSINDSDQGETIPKHFQNNPSDGSVGIVKHYLEVHLDDPESVQYVEWSNVIEDGNKYLVRCTYYARDYSGNSGLNNHVFVITPEGQVIHVFNYIALLRQKA
jgi:hypothetical protein